MYTCMLGSGRENAAWYPGNTFLSCIISPCSRIYVLSLATATKLVIIEPMVVKHRLEDNRCVVCDGMDR